MHKTNSKPGAAIMTSTLTEKAKAEQYGSHTVISAITHESTYTWRGPARRRDRVWLAGHC